MEGLLEVQCQGKIRFIGLSNFGVAQIERCLATGPIHVLQSPYNLFERGIEAPVLPYCRSKRIGTLIYGPLCRGLLSGKYRGHETFSKGDVREMDPKFKGKTFRRYVACVERLSAIATPYGKTVGQMAIRWCLDQPGVTVALCSARRPEQIEDNAGGAGWLLSTTVEEAINRVVTDMIVTPDGPEFMGPP